MPDDTKTEETKEEIVEITETSEVKEETFTEDGLTDGEKELAREHGFKVEEEKEEKDGEHKEQPEPETEDNKDEKDEGEKPKTFEEVEKDETKLKKFNPNEQALYWKYKSDKRKRQAAQKERDDYKAELELNQVKDSASSKKLAKIQEALKGEDLTIEALQAIIGSNAEIDTTPLTKAEYEQIKAKEEKSQKEIKEDNQLRAERIQTAEEIGKTKYENFEELTNMAQAVVDLDNTDTYKGVLEAAFSDTEIDEDNLVERVVTIAKLHPDYGKKKSDKAEEKEEKETNADRAIKNSKKKVSSASVGRGGGKRVINHADLTPDDAASLTTKQWQELPEKVRERILRES